MILRSDDRSQHSTLRTLRWTLAITLLTLVINWEAYPVFAGSSSDEMRKGLQHTGNVNDFANVLSSADRADLESRCLNLRKKTGASLVIVTIDSLQGGNVDDFANKLFNQWGIGQRGKDDGLLLLIAVRDHKFRFEVGYGLEPIIPDALGMRILNEELPNRFRQARYAEGLRPAIDRIAQLIERGKPAAPMQTLRAKDDVPTWLVMMVALFSPFFFGVGLGSKVVSLSLLAFGSHLAFLFASIELVHPMLLIPMSIVLVLTGFATGRLGFVAEFCRGPVYSRRKNYGAISWSKDYWQTEDVGGITWSELAWVWGRIRQVGSGSSWNGGGYGSSSGGFGGGSFGGGSSGGGGGSGGW